MKEKGLVEETPIIFDTNVEEILHDVLWCSSMLDSMMHATEMRLEVERCLLEV